MSCIKNYVKSINKEIRSESTSTAENKSVVFRKGCGTWDAIGVMRMLCERSLEHGNDVYVCFVDFEKAFDRVNWVKMFEIRTEISVC